MTQAAIRETKEESGIDCEITGLVGIYTDPKHVILYTSNGEARQEFSIVLTGRPVGASSPPAASQAKCAGFLPPISTASRWIAPCESASVITWKSRILRFLCDGPARRPPDFKWPGTGSHRRRKLGHT